VSKPIQQGACWQQQFPQKPSINSAKPRFVAISPATPEALVDPHCQAGRVLPAIVPLHVVDSRVAAHTAPDIGTVLLLSTVTSTHDGPAQVTKVEGTCIGQLLISSPNDEGGGKAYTCSLQPMVCNWPDHGGRSCDIKVSIPTATASCRASIACAAGGRCRPARERPRDTSVKSCSATHTSQQASNNSEAQRHQLLLSRYGG
jgi:hypothetical protein